MMEKGRKYKKTTGDYSYQPLSGEEHLKVVSNAVKTNNWEIDLCIGGEYQKYTVRLVRQIGVINETCQVYVNEKERKEIHFDFVSSPSIFCYPREQFAWEDKGHKFVLMFSHPLGKGFLYHLYVNGTDAVTGVKLDDSRKRPWWQFIVAGLVLVFLFIWFMLMHVSKSVFGDPSDETDVIGVVAVIIGVILIMKGTVDCFMKQAEIQYEISEPVIPIDMIDV